MSAGIFQLSRYSSDDGTLFGVRIQPETLAAVIAGEANVAPAGPLPAGSRLCRARGSRRAIGIVARWVSFRWVGVAPAGYKAGGTGTIPVLTKAVWDGASIGSLGDYLGATIEITGKGPEGGR